VQIRTVGPSEIGAVLRRTAGSPRFPAPYLGNARLQWAFELKFPAGRQPPQVQLVPGMAIGVILGTGERLSLMPSRGEANGRLSVRSEPCERPRMQPIPEAREPLSGPLPPRPLDLPRRFTRAVAASYALYVAWADPRRRETWVYSYRHGDGGPVVVAKLPMVVQALGWQPDPHGVLDEITLAGPFHGGEGLVLLTVFATPPTFLAP
jgi:hypothetical protein